MKTLRNQQLTYKDEQDSYKSFAAATFGYSSEIAITIRSDLAKLARQAKPTPSCLSSENFDYESDESTSARKRKRARKKTKKKPTRRIPYPLKLSEFLQKDVEPTAIWWSPDGKSFCINRKEFEKTLLPKYYSTQYTYFKNSLLRWYVSQLA